MPISRRLRLSLRALMFLIVVMAVWMGRQANKANEQRAAVAAVKAPGGHVYFGYDFENRKHVLGRKLRALAWLRRMLGDEYFEEIRHVNMVGNDDRPCDDVIACLANQHGLRTVFVLQPQVTDPGLKHLRGLTELERVSISNSTLIGDDGVEALAGLVNLKNLHLGQSKVTDKGLRALARMTRMEYLDLGSNAFTDEEMEAVAGMKNLTWLRVGGSKKIHSGITDRGIAAVKGMPRLDTLSLDYTRVTDRGLANLEDLSQLTVLTLSGCDVTGEGLTHLTRLAKLKWVILDNTKVGDRGLEQTMGLPSLEWLSLHGTRVTEEAKQALRKSRPTLKVY